MQNKELELKFGYVGHATDLFEIFKNIGKVSDQNVEHLDNTYFDTPNKDLFAIKSGLRIRRSVDYCEQTLKVKGENIGGLHKRNEYNVDIKRSAEVPNLSKFPNEAFPKSFDIDAIQKKLEKVCRINFTRNLFNVELLDSVFEVAYDNGFIETRDGAKHPLNELEVELKETKVKNEDILDLFSLLCTQLANNNIPLVLEPFSKMHRAALLQDEQDQLINLCDFTATTSLSDYLRKQVSIFEKLYGYYLINRDTTVFSLFVENLDNLIKSLKYMKKRKVLAFIKGQKEPLDYTSDLNIILRQLKSFYRVCAKCKHRILKARIYENTALNDELFDKVRTCELEQKIFVIPLKLRLLLSLIVK